MKCCICGKEIEDYQTHNPQPIRREDGKIFDGVNERCCGACNSKFVIPYRICELRHYNSDCNDMQLQVFSLRKAANINIKKRYVVCTVECPDGTVYDQNVEFIHNSLKDSMNALQRQLGKGYYVCSGRIEEE